MSERTVIEPPASQNGPASATTLEDLRAHASPSQAPVTPAVPGTEPAPTARVTPPPAALQPPPSAPGPQAPNDAPSGTVAGPHGVPAASAAAPRGTNLRRILLLNGAGFLVVLLIALGAFYLWHQSYYFYSTDDAVVSGTVANVAPLTPGTLVSVNHGIGSYVHAGDTIVTVRTPGGSLLPVHTPLTGNIVNEGSSVGGGFALGEVLPAGQPVAQVVDLSKLYVTGYVEESHIGDIGVGQGVDVTVDAIKGETFHGTVTRILPATASTFSALPTTDYASGNFTKVQQRIPVQIALSSYAGFHLYPGESAQVTVHIHQ